MADDFQRDMNFADRDTMGWERYAANVPGQRASASSLASMAYSPEQQAPGEDIAGIGHALPIPRSYVPDYVPPTPQPMPPSAGYGGTGAGVVNVIANLLHGFMAGRQIAQARREQQANQMASSAWADYARTAAIASNPDLGDAATAAIKLLPKKAQAYQEIVKKYEPQDQPHRGFLAKVGHAVTSSVTTHDPVLFPKGASESPLPTTPIPLSPAQQAQRAVAKNQVAGADVMASHISNEKTVEGLKTQRDQLYSQIQDATKAGDNAKAADLQAQVKQIEQRAAGLQQQAVVPGALAAQEAQVGAAGDQANLQRRKFANANAALDELNKGTDIWSLPDAQRLALDINPESAAEAKAYLGLVGKPGGFANQREAVIAMQLDKAKAMSTMYGINGGRGALPQIMQAIRMEHPEFTPDQVAEEALRRYKPDTDEKQKPLAPEAFGKARGEISNEVYSTSPELRGLFTNIQTDKKKAPEFILNAGAQPTTHWFWPNEKPEEFAARQNAVREKLWVAGKMRGVNDDQLTQMFGPRPASLGTSAPSGTGVPSAPAASPSPGQPAPQGAAPGQGVPAPPGRASAPPSVNNQMQSWTVTDSKGQSQTIWMTPQEQTQRAADPRFAGFKWQQQGGAQPPSAPSPGAPAPAAAAPAPVAQPAPAAKPAAAAPAAQVKAPEPGAPPAEQIAYIKSLDPEVGRDAENKIRRIMATYQNPAVDLAPESRLTAQQAMQQITATLAEAARKARGNLGQLSQEGDVEAQRNAADTRARLSEQQSAAALARMMAPTQSPANVVASKPSSSAARRP